MSTPLIDPVALVAKIDSIPTMLEVICQTTGMGFAAVARVTPNRWLACSVLDLIDFGLKPGGELKVETTICNEIEQSRRPVIINHVDKDPLFSTHRTPALYGFQSYISVPIILPDGSMFGTLCAIDPKPAELDVPKVRNMFTLFAQLIAFHLDSNQKLVKAEARLQVARKQSELREQFIAILGHDLRNPLAAILAGTRLITRDPSPEKVSTVIALMQNSAQRMGTLIENMLDFTRARLGGGIVLDRRTTGTLEADLSQVVDELRSVNPDRVIRTDWLLGAPVNCDPQRICQLFSNLLGNALAYGSADKPISVRAAQDDGKLLLSVANQGLPIAQETLPLLFEPFARGAGGSDNKGLGLGLHIASAIAKAHGGRIEVVSTEQETRFTFVMPLAVPSKRT